MIDAEDDNKNVNRMRSANRLDAYHGQKYIAHRFHGRLVPFTCFHHGVEPTVNFQHFRQIGE